jgi:hypothetical protein
MRSLGLATIVVGALRLGAAAATAAPSSVIRGDTKIGTFAVQTDGSLAGAIRAFGTPRLQRVRMARWCRSRSASLPAATRGG